MSFAQPVARSRRAAMQQSRNVVEVTSEAQLRAALAALPDPSKAVRCAGKRIVISESFKLSSTVVLNDNHSGLVIDGRHSAGFFTVSSSRTAFRIEDTPTDISFVNIKLGDSAVSVLWDTFIEIQTDASLLLDNVSGLCGVLLGGTGDANGCAVRNCFAGGIQSPLKSCRIQGCRFENNISLSSTRSTFTGNVFGPGVDLTISAGAANAIVGNTFSGGDITTSASSGLNTISANSDVGTITAHASDTTNGDNT